MNLNRKYTPKIKLAVTNSRYILIRKAHALYAEGLFFCEQSARIEWAYGSRGGHIADRNFHGRHFN
jgi:hypothetical protein